MPRFACEAIVLNTIDYLESDRIVCALSREKGLIHAIAKGARSSRRRFPGTLDPMSEVVLELFHKPSMDLLRVESAELRAANLGLREDLDLFAHASVMLELVMNHLGPLDPHPATYACLQAALSSMQPEGQWFARWSIGMLQLLESLGYGVELTALRQKRDTLPGGGFLSPEAAMFLVRGSELEPEVLVKVSLRLQTRREIEAFLLGLSNHVSQKQLKTVAFLAKLLDLDMNQC